MHSPSEKSSAIMSASKTDGEPSSPVLAVCPPKRQNLPYLAVCPAKSNDSTQIVPSPADMHGSFLEPPPLEVQICPTNLDYHEPPPSPSTELPPKQIPDLPVDENAPIICICPPVAAWSSEKK